LIHRGDRSARHGVGFFANQIERKDLLRTRPKISIRQRRATPSIERLGPERSFRRAGPSGEISPLPESLNLGCYPIGNARTSGMPSPGLMCALRLRMRPIKTASLYRSLLRSGPPVPDALEPLKEEARTRHGCLPAAACVRSASVGAAPGLATKRATGRSSRSERRAWDSNPRCPAKDTAVFKTAAIGR
jgi:hypothetical protein